MDGKSELDDKHVDLKRSEDLTTGSIIKKLMIFALPVLMSNIFTQLYNVADTIIVGRFVGSNALAAVGCVGAIDMIVHSILMGIGMGVSVIAAQYYGAKQHEELVKSVNTAFVVCLIAGPLLTVVGLVAGGPLLRLINTPAEIIDDATLYLSIIFCGLIGTMFYHIGSAILRALGDAKYPMYTLIASSILNVGLNILFVTQFKMGVAGVAYATIISQYLVSIAVVVKLIKMRLVRVKKGEFRIYGEMLRPTVRIGLPISIQFMLSSLGMLLLQSFNNSFGANMVATVTVMQKLDGFANMPAMALSTAATTFVGQNIGAGKMDRVKKGVRYILTGNIAVGAIVAVALLIFGKDLLHLFTTNEVVVEMGLIGISIMCFSYCGNGIQQSCTGVIRGAGASFVPMVIMIVTTFVRLPLAYLLAIVPNNYTGIFYALLITAYVGAALMVGYYISGKWKNKAVVKRAPASEIPAEESSAT